MMGKQTDFDGSAEQGRSKKRSASRRLSAIRSGARRRTTKRKRKTDRRFRRGIYLLPGMFTVSNIFCGFLAIISAMHCLSAGGDVGVASGWSLELSALLIGLATLLDTLDGRIARMAGATSQFGFELDSLADMISFGIAPALLFYVWGLGILGRVGWLTAFIYVVCCAARLARFNVRVDSPASDPRYFAGIPSPIAACQLAAFVFFAPEPIRSRSMAVVAMIGCIAVSFLMVSKFRYHSFKKIGLKSRKSYIFVVFVGLILVAIIAAPQVVLLGLALTYTASGPVQKLITLPFFRHGNASVPIPTERGAGSRDQSGSDNSE